MCFQSNRFLLCRYTKQWTLKESSDCAPNGYYFIPLYDKGEYILKIEPPVGWHFEPKEVYLNFDGANDPCSKANDINFMFRGFAIYGKVFCNLFLIDYKLVLFSLYTLQLFYRSSVKIVLKDLKM